MNGDSDTPDSVTGTDTTATTSETPVEQPLPAMDTAEVMEIAAVIITHELATIVELNQEIQTILDTPIDTNATPKE